MFQITTFAEATQVLSDTLPGYESRPQQVRFAEAVEESIRTRTHLLAEAGTGTGKSIGYLVPAILSGKRVVISTATKALQTQIWTKDVPFLQENLIPFRAALLKGRSNYICVNKLMDADPADIPHRAELLELIQDNIDPLSEYPLNPDFSGEREDLPFEVEHREWMKIAGETDDCKVYHCKDNFNCFAQRARSEAVRAQVVVVNHALYLTDLLVKELSGGNATMLGNHSVVIFDESHEIEDYAGSTLGSTFREGGIRQVAAEIRNFARRDLPGQEHEGERIATHLISNMDALWSVLRPGRIRQAELIEWADQLVDFANALQDAADWIVSSEILEMVSPGELSDVKKRKARLEAKVLSAANRFAKIITDSMDDSVRWVEIDKDRPVLKTAPINVSDYLRDWLFGTGEVTAILVSATLSVAGSFDYISTRLGIDEYDSLDVGTPFDYGVQALTYVPSSLPDPAKQKQEWSAHAIQEMRDLITLSGGRALLLFTSISEMRNAYDQIAPRVDYRCIMQGQTSNKVLAQQFKDEETSVLFATKSFMTGVDFQGDTLKMVIINKLPFPVPTEPLVEARCESIKKRGGNDFQEYTIPVMSLILKQAYGRLIRHRDDTGVVAILDPRLITKGYGKNILRSLPDAPVVESFAAVEDRYGMLAYA